MKIITKKARIYSVNPEAAILRGKQWRRIFSVCIVHSEAAILLEKPRRRIFLLYIVHPKAAILRGKQWRRIFSICIVNPKAASSRKTKKYSSRNYVTKTQRLGKKIRGVIQLCNMIIEYCERKNTHHNSSPCWQTEEGVSNKGSTTSTPKIKDDGMR